MKDIKEEEHSSVILNKVKEKLQEEDRFDQEEYRKKVKSHGQVPFKKQARREASKRQTKAKTGGGCLLGLGW